MRRAMFAFQIKKYGGVYVFVGYQSNYYLKICVALKKVVLFDFSRPILL